jgi:hypothetical protein
MALSSRTIVSDLFKNRRDAFDFVFNKILQSMVHLYDRQSEIKDASYDAALVIRTMKNKIVNYHNYIYKSSLQNAKTEQRTIRLSDPALADGSEIISTDGMHSK